MFSFVNRYTSFVTDTVIIGFDEMKMHMRKGLTSPW